MEWIDHESDSVSLGGRAAHVRRYDSCGTGRYECYVIELSSDDPSERLRGIKVAWDEDMAQLRFTGDWTPAMGHDLISLLVDEFRPPQPTRCRQIKLDGIPTSSQPDEWIAMVERLGFRSNGDGMILALSDAVDCPVVGATR